jgi:hypothetical protein
MEEVKNELMDLTTESLDKKGIECSAIQALTDNFSKNYTDIKDSPELKAPPLSNMCKTKIISIIKTGIQSKKRQL